MYFSQTPRVCGALLSCAALLLISGTARAQSYRLSDLIAGTSGTDGRGGVVVGDKRFSNFSYFIASGTGMATAANIAVVGQTVAGNLGLEFNGNWFATAGNSGEAIIDYTVTVVDPNFRITDIHLDGDPVIFNGGPGIASVTESVSDAINHLNVLPVGHSPLNIFAVAAGGITTSHLNDNVDTIGSHVSLDIEKTIAVSVAAPGAVAQVTHIQQTFSQSSRVGVAPEPGSASLILAAGALLAGFVPALRRRRSSASL